MRTFMVVGLSALVLSACATIVKGTTQAVALNTPGVPGAQCTLSSPAIGTKIVVTPAQLTLDKAADNIQVICKKECYQDGVGIIPSHTEAMAAGNIIAGGIIGLGVDAASGAMNKYNADNQIAMVPDPPCKAPTPAAKGKPRVS
jgi:phosphoketolase